MKKGLLLCLALTVAGISAAHAARSAVGTSGAVFLKLNAGARPAAMGEAFGGVAGDVNALFYNPAGAAFLPDTAFTAQYGSWFQDIGYNALGFASPTRYGSFGIGIINLSVTDIERRSADTAEADGTFGASDYAYFLHYSRQLAPSLGVGVNAKLISQKLDDRTASALAGDAGLLWQSPVKGLSAGAAVQNFGQEVKFDREGDPLPLNVKCGLAWQLSLSDDRTRFLSSLDVNFPRDNDTLVCAGAEIGRRISGDFSVALRGGYKTVSQEELGGLTGLTAGAGMTWRRFSLDFAWVPYGDLGDTFRYSLSARF